MSETPASLEALSLSLSLDAQRAGANSDILHDTMDIAHEYLRRVLYLRETGQRMPVGPAKEAPIEAARTEVIAVQKISPREAIRAKRKELGITQLQLAVNLDTHPDAISRFERGTQDLDDATMRKLVSLLGLAS